MSKKISKDSLGDRMKGYENISRIYLTKRLPLIIRIDGRCFHQFTKKFQKPFDRVLMRAMQETMLKLCKEIAGCKVGYVQSDEISLLITDYDNLETSPWFEKNLQKLVSISASMATLYFNRAFAESVEKAATDLAFRCGNKDSDDWDQINIYRKALNKGATFDSRAFILPKEECQNYFIWRQQDATRNSIRMAGRAYYSHKELDHKNTSQVQDMLMDKGINWNDYQVDEKRGICAIKVSREIRPQWELDKDTPIFTQDQEYIEKWVN